MLLYHGTTERHLPNILKNGIRPRRHHQKDNWKHTVSSNSHCVYLSVAYPLYFASASLGDDDDDERLIVLEIDSNKLNQSLLCADEDFLAQANLNPKMKHLDIKAKNNYYKRVMSKYSYQVSLTNMGNCAYRGTIPIEAIIRIVFVSHNAYIRLLMHGYDPMISILNYKIKGEGYVKSTKWLFDPELIPQEYSEFPNPYDLGKTQLFPELPITESREGIEVLRFQDLISKNS